MSEPPLSELATATPRASDEDTIADEQLGASRRPEAVELREGTAVGRYHVLETLGRGAMGVVYAAYDPDLDRKVALKIIRFAAGDDARTAQAQERLRREAQALAQLSHPHVVGILDVGRAAGQLFIAMELVEGRTLTRWLREAPRTWREVVDAFTQAGRGLAAAHAANLIHRDFKPDNVLVGADGRVRVMDFGLARVGDGKRGIVPILPVAPVDATVDTSLTVDGIVPGTPAYMAPEHHEHGVLDARSDQFSFCVALYEGLYGERPFRGDNLAALAVAVCKDPAPPRPARSRVPDWIHQVLLRGLAKDPDTRFPTMDALLRALGRDPTVRRRALRIGGVVVLGGLVVAGAMAFRAHQIEARCEEAGASIRSVWNPDAAAALESTLLAASPDLAPETWPRTEPHLAAYTDAWQAMRADVCRRATVTREWPAERLARAEECLDERRARLEAVLEVLAGADQDVLLRAVDIVAGLPDLAPCGSPAALERRGPRPEDPARRERIAEHRKQLQRAATLQSAGQYEDAKRLAAQVVEDARADAQEPLVLEALVKLGQCERSLDDFAAAEEHLQAAYFGAEQLDLHETALDAAASMAYLTGVRLARAEEGLQWGRHAEGALARLGMPDELELADLLVVRASIHDERGAYDEAIADYERALAIQTAVLGEDHPSTVSSLAGLGHVYFNKGQEREAFRSLERVLVIRERALGPDHLLVAETLNNLGMARMAEGDYEAARALLERSLAIRRRLFGDEHTTIANALAGLADLAYVRKDFEASAALNRRVAAMRERLLGSDHPMVAHAFNNLGSALDGLSRHEEAIAAYTRALGIVQQALGPHHPNTLIVQWSLAETLLKSGRHADALRAFDEARATQRRAKLTAAKLADYDAEYVRQVWSLDGVDRAQLRRLATEARAELAAAGPGSAKALADLDAWLAEHPAEPTAPAEPIEPSR